MANDNEPSTNEPSTNKVQSHMNKLFNIGNRNNDNGFPLNLSDVQRIQNLELNIRNSKLKAFIEDSKSGYYYDFIEDMKLIDDVKIKIRPRLISHQHKLVRYLMTYGYRDILDQC